MAQYYWEADSADEGFLPTNATVTEPWHSWTTLTVEASTAHVDFGYSLQGYAASSGSVRRVAAFSAIDGNSLTQSGVTEIYAVIAASRTYIDHGVMGRISGDDTSETGVGCKFMGGSNDFDTVQYDSGSGSILSADTYDAARPESVRVQYDGSTVRFRRWHYGDAEPGTWDFVETVGVTGAGDWGLHAFGYTYGGHYAELLALGFGNNGDAAPTEAVSSGTTINAGSKGLTLSALLAAITLSITVNAGVANASITTYPATVSQGITVAAGVDNLVITTYTANVSSPVEISAGTASITLVSYAADISQGTGINVETAALGITTYPASITAAIEVNAETASLNLVSYTATVSVATTINTVAATLNISTYPALIIVEPAIDANVVGLTITTYPVVIEGAITISADVAGLNIVTHKATARLIWAWYTTEESSLTTDWSRTIPIPSIDSAAVAGKAVAGKAIVGASYAGWTSKEKLSG